MATLAEQWDTVDEAPARPVTQRSVTQPAVVNNNAANQQSFQQQANLIPSLQARINGTDPVDAERAKAELAALYQKMNGPALTQQPTEEKSLPTVTVTGNSTGTLADLWNSPETAINGKAPAVPAMQPSEPEMARDKEPILKGIASVLDNTIGGVIPYTAQQAAQLLGRVITQDPKEAKAWGEQLASILDKPFGKAFGITDDPAYKNEATRRLFEFVGENASKGAEWIEKNTGGVIPKEDAEWMINMALPKVIEAGGGLLTKGKKAVEEKISPEMGPSIHVDIAGVNKERVEPTFGEPTEQVQSAARPTEPVVPQAAQPTVTEPVATAAEQLQAQLEAKKPEQTTQPVDQLQEQLKTKQQQQAEPLGSARQRAPDEPFTPVEYGESGVSRAEQKNRAATLQRLGFDEVRENVIEGHGKDRATDYQTSKTDTPLGNYLKDEFDKEKKIVNKFAQSLIKETGGTFGLDESSVYSRGNTILQPLKDLETYFDKATEKIYADRDAIAKDIPVVANNILSKLNDRTLVEISDPSERLAKTAKVKMEQLGMLDEKGNLLPTDAYHSELFRKWLNQNWSREANQLHKALKDAVDDDVIANLDTNSSLYNDARNLVTERKNTLDNPKGISNILDASGPKDINRKVDVEKIPNSVAGMPVDQFTHVIDTLKNVPEELKPLANKALSEIKAQFANRVYEAMGKGADKLTTFLDANREKMARLFTAEEIAKFRDLHNGVHILKTDTGYPGSKVQTINVEQKLGEKVASHLISKGAAVAAETLTGAHTMGVAGTLTHEFVRKKQEARQTRKLQEAEKAQFEKEKARYHKLSDLLEEK